MSADRIKFVCTDKGQHASIELAVFEWMGDMSKGTSAVWSPGEGTVLNPQGESARGTNTGGTWHVKRKSVRQITRADGGTTYHLPPCPRCRKTPKPMRDTTLRKMRDTVGDIPIDVRPVR